MAHGPLPYDLLLREALRKIEGLEHDLKRTQAAKGIAIIGMACRFPGSRNVQAFWDLLSAGGSAICETPSDRWDAQLLYDPNPDAVGKVSTRYGGFLDGLANFDPAFFGISPREALSLDPQQRLLLEVAWEALEDSAIAVRDLPSNTGVFVGLSNVDSREAFSRQQNAIDGYFASGNTGSTASGRLAYLLGVTGPCLSVDTACSASLVTIHLAIRSLRDSECDLALAGGVNCILTPSESISLSRARMLSPDGRCKTFDAAADGYVRSEGCGLVALKRLADAERDGDRVLAVIAGSAINQDGRRSGLTVPNGPAQQAVIRRALFDAGLQPRSISYVEAHGTGTAVGDPIEAQAIGSVFTDRQSPLKVGAVKTNIGHLEAASGVAGLIKVVLALSNEMIPPNLHFETPNPLIMWDSLPIEIPTSPIAWTGERHAGVSSFGFSGTNAHVVVSSAPPPVFIGAGSGVERGVHVLALSAKSEAALAALAARYEARLGEGPVLADLCHTAAVGRSHFDHRLAVTSRTGQEMAAGLQAWREGREGRGGVVVSGHAGGGSPSGGKVAFLFTGQGSQYVGMGRELYESQPTFRGWMDRCAEELEPYLERPLLSVLYPEQALGAPLIDETAFTQPALFALEYSLAQLWRSWGIEPDVVIGHSVGEYVAACVAGVFQLKDGLRLVAERGRLMQRLPRDGAMAAVAADASSVAAVLEPYGQVVTIAAINGPANVVLSGEREALEAVCKALEQREIKTRQLTVSHAFHSPLMEPMVGDFASAAQSVAYRTPEVILVSNLTGEAVGAAVARAKYWTDHVRQPVRFAQGVDALRALGVRTFLEIGPRPTLLAMAREQLADLEAVWLASLRPDRDWAQMLETLAQFYVQGRPINWRAFDQDYPRRKIPAPTYPFQRQRYWPKSITLAVHVPSWSEWLTEVDWAEVDLMGASAAGGRWLVLGPEMAAGTLRRVLEASDQSVIGDTLEEGLAAKPDHVVWLAEASAGRTPVERAQAATNDLLLLVQALARYEEPLRLWIVTREAQAVTAGAMVQPDQTAVWGMARAIAAEHPEFSCICVDFDMAHDSRQIAETLLRAPRQENQIARRETQLFSPRLERREMPVLLGKPLRRDGTYLITGGLGGLGLRVALGLARAGASRLVLASRSGQVSEAAKAVLAEIRQAGSVVTTVQADVSLAADAARIVELCRAENQLVGVIHAAGILDDGLLVQQTPERMAAVLAPKTDGAWNLHILTEQDPLDHFVLFSSVAVWLEEVRRGPYAAANAFLDGLAHLRRAAGKPALAINWGPWSAVGMATQSAAGFEKLGLHPIPPEEGARATIGLMSGNLLRASVMALPADWNRFREMAVWSGSTHLFDRVAPAPRTEPPLMSPVHQALKAAPDPRDFIEQRIKSAVTEILGVGRSIDFRYGFFDLGMDSLMVMELRGRLQSDLGCSLTATGIFKYPRVPELAAYIAEQLGQSVSVKSCPHPSPLAVAAKASSGLPIEAMMAEIAQKFRRLQ